MLHLTILVCTPGISLLGAGCSPRALQVEITRNFPAGIIHQLQGDARPLQRVPDLVIPSSHHLQTRSPLWYVEQISGELLRA